MQTMMSKARELASTFRSKPHRDGLHMFVVTELTAAGLLSGGVNDPLPDELQEFLADEEKGYQANPLAPVDGCEFAD